MKKKSLFSLLLFATCLFSVSAQTLISEDFSSAAWGSELLRLNPTYVKPPNNTTFFELTTTQLYFGNYAMNGAIVTFNGTTSPNTTNVCALFSSKGIVHNNGGKAVAFRFRNTGITSFFEFPQITSAGNITLHVRNGNSTTASTLTLQKYVGGAWTTITTLAVKRADIYYTTKIDEIITYNININAAVKLRIYGGDKFIHLFRVDIDAHYKAGLLSAINSATAQQTANAGNIGTTLGTYSQASYDTFGAAITAANTVNANGSATQTQVDAAVVTLNAAVATFFASINKLDLQTGITTATTLKNANAGNIGTTLGKYTQASYDALGAAITTASAVNTNVTATGAQVIAALATLNTAVATFQASVNKVDLQTGITTATTLKNASTSKIGGGIGQYTQASYDALVDAITAASAVNSNATATGAEVIAALATLNTAITTFQTSVIPAELININFTTDSTYWRSNFPAVSVHGNDLSTAVADGTEVDSYLFKGWFGKFDPGAGVRAQPLRTDNLGAHRRWAFRIDNTGDSYLELPPLTSVGKFTIYCKNGNETVETVFYIQKKVGSTWTTIKTIYAPPHYDRNYEQQVEEYLNINSAVTLRIYGATRYIHIFKVVVNSYDATKPAEKPLKLVLLPDPQAYANNTDLEPVYASQTTWIANNSDSIKFVLCQGDMTQTNSDNQWSIAAGALTILNGKKVPFTFIPGNHDMGSPGFANTRNTTMLNTYLPASRYSRDSSFGGVFEANKMENSWSTFSKGSYNFLILSLEYGPREKVIDWAKTVISSHPYHNIIINTHAYLGANNGRLTDGISQEIGNLTGEDFANDGDQMWNKMVKLYKNVLIVFCGHILGDGTGRLVSTANNGNKVYQLMANYQGGVDGTEAERNGMLKIVDLDTSNKTLSVETYSPYSDTYRTESDQKFVYTNVQYMKNNGQYVKGEITGVEESASDKIKIALEGKNLRVINVTGNTLTTVVYTMQGVKVVQRSSVKTENIILPISGCYIVYSYIDNETESVRRKIIVP